MERVQLRNDRLNKPETVAEYLGISKRTVIDLARGNHPSGKTLPCVEVMPKVLRFRGTDIAKWEQANYCAIPHGLTAK
jgi:hypothetical protein